MSTYVHSLHKTKQPHLFRHLHIAVREHLAGALVQGEGLVVSMQLTVGPYPREEISCTAELYVRTYADWTVSGLLVPDHEEQRCWSL